ncbi:MAG: ABC transporter substrate-binding protein [Micromonosporaceae bacterium]|nr:ABC transporter substrate-binding protein [Micromonosporaceae bacterium]
MRAPIRAVALVAAVGMVAATALVAACSPTEPPSEEPYVPPRGVTEKEIRLGTHQPLTGPASSYSRVSVAMKAYFDHVNAHGGVHGRQITLMSKDDAYNPANTQTVVRELVEQDEVFAIVGGLGTPTHSAVLDYLKDEQVPDLFVASGAGSWNQPARYPGTFGFQTDYTTEGKIVGHYLAEESAGETICAFHQDDDFGRQFVAGVEAGLGTPVALRQSYITSNTNVAPQVQAMQSAGCTVVVLATLPTFTAQVLRTADQLSFRPQFVASTSGSDYATVGAILGVDKALLEGLISTGYLPIATNPNDPWIALFQRIMDEYGDGGEVDNNVVVGMSIAYLTVQALQRAGREITVDGLIAAIEQGGFTGPGLVPFGFSPTSHAGYSGGRMSKVTNGTQDYFGPAYVTDAGSAPVTEYTEPAAVPPPDGIPTP